MPGFRIRLRFSDGVHGVIDLSSNVGKGVFAALADPAVFQRVHIGQFGQIAWSEELEICPDAAYREIVQQRAAAATHAGS